MIHVDTVLLTLVTGTLIPIATAVITKAHASNAVKGSVSAILAAVTAIATVLTQYAGVISWETAAVVGIGALAVQGATWFGFWKPTGIGPKVAANTPGLIGPASPAAA